jgi:hypothetical protein
MLSFNYLGNLGRLANQMFQYASLKGIATHRGYEFSIPPREVFGQSDGNVKKSDVILYDLFSIEQKNKIEITNNPFLQERVHTFDEELFCNCPDNVDLLGYYQSEKYFKHIENEIREDFRFNTTLKKQCDDFFEQSFDTNEVISLHVRRGDYVIDNNHPLQDLSYYQRALKLFGDTTPVIIFSDDPEWCKNQSLFETDRFLISDQNTTDLDLCMMTLCKYHIIANSSFSWWGAWLAKSEKIVAPKKWFGGNNISKNVDDMEFGDWVWL